MIGTIIDIFLPKKLDEPRFTEEKEVEHLMVVEESKKQEPVNIVRTYNRRELGVSSTSSSF